MMIKLMRHILVIAMLGVVSAGGAFAQRRGQDREKRPPKEPAKVITNDRKDNRPPPRNTNDKPKPEKPKRP